MPTQREPRAEAQVSLWHDLRDLARFVAEALAVSGGIIILALLFL